MPSLADIDVLVVDAQTTGATPALGVVLELGWGVVRAGAPGTLAAESRWIRLPEGHRVPWQVARLTGYDPAMAGEAIAADEAWRRLRAATADTDAVPTVIHYARFELTFLRDWAERFEPGRPFPLDVVCVHAIARRLYPELPRRSLRALAGFLGHGVDLTRRSLGHVQATAFVWQRLCDVLAARGIVGWTQLADWLSQPEVPAPSPTGRRRRRYPVDAARYRSLPDQPGVYRFLRSNGDLLYVGKAASLRKRVSSHFAGRSNREFSVEMLTQVSDIHVDVAASALEAALLENETIKALRPPYNVQLVGSDPRVWFSDHDFASAVDTPDDGHRVGPVPSQHALRPLHAQVALLSGAAPTFALRAAAVGASELWTPDASVFAAGWELFLSRNAARLSADQGPPRAQVLALAAALLLSPSWGKAVDAEEDDADTDGGSDVRPDWDPPRVARHLERAGASAYLLYRRSRWLRLLFDSDVVYREPDSPRARRLSLRAGQLVLATDAQAGDAPPAEITVAPSVARFDRATYDRLRILTTDLRRIMRDGGTVWMRPFTYR